MPLLQRSVHAVSFGFEALWLRWAPSAFSHAYPCVRMCAAMISADFSSAANQVMSAATAKAPAPAVEQTLNLTMYHLQLE